MRPKKIPASFHRPKKIIFGQNFRPKKPLGPPLPPPLHPSSSKYVSGAPGDLHVITSWLYDCKPYVFIPHIFWINCCLWKSHTEHIVYPRWSVVSSNAIWLALLGQGRIVIDIMWHKVMHWLKCFAAIRWLQISNLARSKVQAKQYNYFIGVVVLQGNRMVQVNSNFIQLYITIIIAWCLPKW